MRLWQCPVFLNRFLSKEKTFYGNNRRPYSGSAIIVGLTGPIGSGCTTLSKFLGDEDYETEKGLSHYLLTEKYIKEGEKHEINSNLLDKRIKQRFEEKRHVKSGPELNDIHSQAKALLERREFIYSLDHLLTTDFYQNRLRISCSSIIVFDLVRNINTEPDDKIQDIIEFQQTLRGFLAHDYGQLDKEFEQVFDMVKKYFHHDPLDGERKHEPDIPRLKKCFENVKVLKKKLTELKSYRALMQDFGDNIRSTGNPYVFLRSIVDVDQKDDFQRHNYTIARYIDYIIHYYMNSDEKIRFFVIDSFRNPMCIKYLRHRYPKFFLISIFASSKTRLGRIPASQKEDFYDQDARDQGKHSETHDPFFKQNVRKTVLMSDIAINSTPTNKRSISN